jgi:hypothetical protein
MYCWGIANSRLRDQICNIRTNAYAVWIQITVEQKTIELTEKRGGKHFHRHGNTYILQSSQSPRVTILSPSLLLTLHQPCAPFQILRGSCRWQLSQVILCTRELPLWFYQKVTKPFSVLVADTEGDRRLTYKPILLPNRIICTHISLNARYVMYLYIMQ